MFLKRPPGPIHMLDLNLVIFVPVDAPDKTCASELQNGKDKIFSRFRWPLMISIFSSDQLVVNVYLFP